MRKIMCLGMGRSGTHAIIRWIANGIGGQVREENNCFNGWDEKKFLPNSIKIVGKGELSGIIKSIDDFYLPLWYNLKMDTWEEFDKILTIVRSPRNWLASSIAAGGWARKHLTEAPKNEPELPVSRIQAYYKYILPTKYIKNVVHIYYDNWFKDKKYRKTFCRLIGIKDTGIPSHCKFSSFGKNHDYNGDRYELLNKEQKKIFDELIRTNEFNLNVI